MKKLAILDISICAACIALHIILERLAQLMSTNDIKLPLGALPFLVAAFLCGPLEGFICGLVGTFLSQILSYGITVTTPVWILPYAMEALTAGLMFKAFHRRLDPKSVGIIVFVSGFIRIVLNFAASYLDGVVVFKYMTSEALIAVIPFRLLIWAGFSVIFTAILLPVTKALLKSCPAGLKRPR